MGSVAAATGMESTPTLPSPSSPHFEPHLPDKRALPRPAAPLSRASEWERGVGSRARTHVSSTIRRHQRTPGLPSSRLPSTALCNRPSFAAGWSTPRQPRRTSRKRTRPAQCGRPRGWRLADAGQPGARSSLPSTAGAFLLRAPPCRSMAFKRHQPCPPRRARLLWGLAAGGRGRCR